MDLTRGIFCDIYRAEKEVDEWLRNEGVEWVKSNLTEIREHLICLNKLYESSNYDGVGKSSLPGEFFVGNTADAIEYVNTQISLLHKKDFERWWCNAFEKVGKYAEVRLGEIYPDRDVFPAALLNFRKDRRELFENLHCFINPVFVKRVFSKWRAFDVMLDKNRNQWCFVFTPPYQYISGVMEDFTRNKPHELTRSLEYGFRRLLGDYGADGVFDERCPFKHPYGWYHSGDGSYVNRYEMSTRFKSYKRE